MPEAKGAELGVVAALDHHIIPSLQRLVSANDSQFHLKVGSEVWSFLLKVNQAALPEKLSGST